MRWSLILSAFVTFEFVLSSICAALLVPQSLVELERRGTKEVRKDSKTYRNNAMNHGYAYEVNSGSISQKSLETQKERQDWGKDMIKTSGMQADHVYELQAFMHNLEKGNGLRYQDLTPVLKKEVKDVLNSPGNMAFIPGYINQAKGRLVGKALRGGDKKLGPDAIRDAYTKLSYPTAMNTAKTLDKVLQEHGHTLRTSFEKSLVDVMTKANILKPESPLGPQRSARSRPAKAKQDELKTARLTRPSKRTGLRSSSHTSEEGQASISAASLAPMPKVRTSSRQRASNADPVKAGRGSPPGFSAKSQVQIPTRQRASNADPVKAGRGSPPGYSAKSQVQIPTRQRASNADPVKAGRGSHPGYISAKSQVQIPTRQPVNSKAGQGSRSISQDSKPKVRIPIRQPVKAGQGSRSVSQASKPKTQIPSRQPVKAGHSISQASKPKVRIPTRQPVKAGQGSRSVSRAQKPKVQIPTRQPVKSSRSVSQASKPKVQIPVKAAGKKK